MTTTERYLSVPEAAARLGLTRQTVRRRILRGEMAAVRVGRGWALTVGEVEAWAKRGRQKPGPKRRGAKSEWKNGDPIEVDISALVGRTMTPAEIIDSEVVRSQMAAYLVGRAPGITTEAEARAFIEANRDRIQIQLHD